MFLANSRAQPDPLKARETTLTLLNFSAHFSEEDSSSSTDNVLYRYDAAVFGFLFYALVLGVVTLRRRSAVPRLAEDMR